MKSFVAFLIISSMAYLAFSQTSACGTPATNCAACAAAASISSNIATTIATATGVSNWCVACSSGFLLTANTGCTALTNGCLWGANSSYCFSGGCNPVGYVYYATNNSCVALGTNVLVGTISAAGVITPTTCAAGYGVNGTGCSSCGTGIATCTIASTTVTILTCSSGYVANPTVSPTQCFSCTGTTAATPTGGSSVLGIANCATCTVTGVAATGTGTPNTVTCTACAWGYSLYPITAAGKPGPTSATGSAQTAAFCFNTTSTVTAANLAAISTVVVGGVINLVSALTADTGCANFALVVPTVASATFTSQYCTAPLAGYLCTPAAATVGSSCYAISAGALTGTGGMGCASGLTAASATATPTAASAVASCWSCITGYNWVATAPTTCNTAGSCAGSCVWANNLPGFNMLTNGSVVACSANGTACNGGPATGSILYANGSYIAGTAGVSGCLISNSTTNCLLCQSGYATAIPSCLTACSANCNTCTSTGCSTCKTGFTASSTGTCTSSSGTGSSANVLLSGLAFVSMIFYYIF